MRNMETTILKRLSLLMVLLCLHTKSGHSLLITVPHDTEVLVNHSTYFNCSTSILSEQIHWYHNHVGENRTIYVYYKGQFNQIYAERYSAEINIETGGYNLIIRSVQPGDAGRYSCRDDGGLGNISSAELIVLDSTPACLPSMKPDGFVGPNSCYLTLETLQLSCRASYIGNIHPLLQWKMHGNDASISEGITTDYSVTHATVNLTTNSTVQMNGDFFICSTTRSHYKQFSCSTDAVKINYAVGQPTILNVTKGETIKCSANASVPCTYRWFYDNDTQYTVSFNQDLTTNRLGKHSCEASCPINGISCTFVAIRIIVFEDETSGQMKQSPCTADEESNEVLGPNINPSTYNKGETLSLLTAGTEPNTTDEVTPLNEGTSVDNGAEKEASFAGDNNIIQTHIKVEEITTDASLKMGRAIAGVAALDGLIYVVSDKSSEVEMFDIRTHEFKDRRILVELENPWDLTSCMLNKCLYIMDLRSPTTPKYVIRVNSNGKILVKWSTGDEYGNLSVTFDGNVIAAFCDSRRLVIYSPDGTERTVVPLSEDTIHPSHALKLSNNQLMICHGINKDNIHRVCILNKNGEIIKNSFERMESPSYMAVNETGFIFVADQGNRRVIVLNSDLELKGKVVSKQNGLRGPQRIVLHGNRSTGKLFVVDNDVRLESKRRDGKILIFSYDLQSK